VQSLAEEMADHCSNMQADERLEGFLLRRSEPNSPTVEREHDWVWVVGGLGGCIRHNMVDDGWSGAVRRSEAQHRTHMRLLQMISVIDVNLPLLPTTYLTRPSGTRTRIEYEYHVLYSVVQYELGLPTNKRHESSVGNGCSLPVESRKE
jgi:hypothetical protein